MVPASSVALLLAWGSAFAPLGEAGGRQDDPKGAPTFEDLKSSLGELEEKKSREDTEKRDAIVQKNQEETLKIYGDTLGKRNGDVQNVAKRLEINKALLSKYGRALEQARADLATLQAQYINRTVALKRSQEQGRISPEAHDKLLEEDTKRFRNREKELADDIASYQEEVRIAERQEKDLALKKELMEYDPFGGEKPEEKAGTPRLGYGDKMRRTVTELSGYRPRSVLDSLK